MKNIFNWKNATVFDIEADALLDDATKIHVLSFDMKGGKKGSISGLDGERIKAFFKYHLDNKIPVVAHNGICYDIPLVEKILNIDLSELMVIDTLGLSWYTFHDRNKHGLDSFFDDYGIAKPKVADEQWAGLTQDQLDFINDPENENEEGYQALKAEYAEHYELMKHRCETDVEINRALWDDICAHLTDMYKRAKQAIDYNLVDGRRTSKSEVCYIDQYKNKSTTEEYIDRILTFLNHKMGISRLKEKTRFKLDGDQVEQGIVELEELIAIATKELESVMPQVPKYTKKNKPKQCYKQNGDLSAHGIKWNELLEKIGEIDDQGNIVVEAIDAEELKVLSKYEPPNIDSVAQIKKFLFSKGWEPETFKYEVDEEAMQEWVSNGCKKGQRPEQRKIPQINKEGDDGKELCDSVKRLAENVPEINAYAKYTVIKHRYGVLKSFKENVSEDGFLKARNGGFTNTLREKHRELVNLPSDKKPYAKYIRSSLVAVIGEVLCGSDLSSLEDRVKHHFMLPYDPDYVNTMMADDFDPHLLSACASGLITEEDITYFKECKKTGETPDKPRYTKIGSARQLGKTSNYACLPIDTTEVLTSKGWKWGKDVVVGDLVLSYNVEKDCNEFVLVQNTVYFSDREVIRVGHHDWSIESTGDHRWFGTKRKMYGSNKSNKRVYENCVFTTDEIMSEHCITNSKPFVGGGSSVTPNQAALVAWLLSDGYWKWSDKGEGTSDSFGTKRGLVASVAQAIHKYQSTVEHILSINKIQYTTGVQEVDNGNHVTVYRLAAGSFREFYRQVISLDEKDKHDFDWVSWVLKLSKESLQSFVYHFWLGDGDSKGNLEKSFWTFKQVDGNIAEALAVAGYLLGFNTTHIKKDGIGTIRMQKERGYTTCQRFRHMDSRQVDVFCLTTENSNFVIRQGKIITITGNCVYGAGAEKISLSAKIPLATAKQLHKGYWELNWAVKAIAEDCCTITDAWGLKWLINPINGFCYSIRSEKDKFSTLCQGTGSFLFDMWVDKFLEKMYAQWKTKRLSGTFHDELILSLRDHEGTKAAVEKMLKDSINEVTEQYFLRRKLGCDVQFGARYSEIH